MDEIRVNIDK